MQIHQKRARWHPFPDRKQVNRSQKAILGAGFQDGIRRQGRWSEGSNGHSHGRETSRSRLRRRQNQSHAAAHLGGELQPARLPLIESVQGSDDDGHPSAAQRLIHSPESVAPSRRANHDEPLGIDTERRDGRRIKISCSIKNDQGSFAGNLR